MSKTPTSAPRIPQPFGLGLWLATNDLRRQFDLRQRVRENFGLSLEDDAVRVLIAGHAKGEFLTSTAMEFKMLADRDFVELGGWGA